MSRRLAVTLPTVQRPTCRANGSTEQYGVDEDTALVDFDALLDQARSCQPKIILAGGSAYPRTLDFAKFREVADAVGAYLMVDMAHISGLVAAGVHPNPVPHAHIVTSTTHKTLRAGRGGIILSNDEALGKKINSAVFPGLQGDPLMHAIAGKAAGFGKRFVEFRVYEQVVANARCFRNADRTWPRHRFWRYRHASCSGRSAAKGWLAISPKCRSNMPA